MATRSSRLWWSAGSSRADPIASSRGALASSPALENTLNDLPIADRLSALLVSIVESNPGALAVSLSMVAATKKLSEGLSVENRFRIANAMRHAADELERRQVVHIAG